MPAHTTFCPARMGCRSGSDHEFIYLVSDLIISFSVRRKCFYELMKRTFCKSGLMFRFSFSAHGYKFKIAILNKNNVFY